MKSQTADDESNEANELADRHNGVDVERENIQATMEYSVVVEQETIEELPEGTTASEFAENLAASRMNAELDPTFRISSGDAIASENENFRMSSDRHFDVFVRVSQND